MEIIKCKECGKELSSKAEICPNCGVRIKKKSLISKAFKFFEIIGVLIVIGIIIFFAYEFIRNLMLKSEEKEYVGTWKLQTSKKEVSYDVSIEQHGAEEGKILNKTYTIILDEELKIEKENVYYGNILESCSNTYSDKVYTKRCEEVPIVVRLNKNDKVSAINFVLTDGDNVLLCFERSGDTIKQRSCKGANSDKYNDSLYSMNGGIDEDFDIVYKKVK